MLRLRRDRGGSCGTRCSRRSSALVADAERGAARRAELAELCSRPLRPRRAAGARLQLDVSIARGLDYYTGIGLRDVPRRLPDIGSVCSGGRYDNLAGLYTKEQLPGIGASLGLDRLLAAMEELGLLGEAHDGAPVFIPFFDAARLHDYLRLAAAPAAPPASASRSIPSRRSSASSSSTPTGAAFAWRS